MPGSLLAHPPFFEEIRKLYGELEYLAVVELTTGKRTPGHRPHLHLLVRGPNVPKWWLKQRWRFHTKGSFMVDMQPLRSPRHAGEYLIGYTMLRRKQAQRAHLDQWPGPRIRYSRHFFPRPVAEIRAILWPPAEPGMWEYVGPVPCHWQLVWTELAPEALRDRSPECDLTSVTLTQAVCFSASGNGPRAKAGVAFRYLCRRLR